MFAINRSKSSFFVPVLCFLFLALAFCNIVLAQDSTKEVRAVGTGTVQNQGIVGAKEEAISIGLANAVARVIEDHIPAEIISANFKTLDEAFLSVAGDYIRDYRVLTENKSKTKYRIYVQASVLSDKIKKKLSDLGIILSETNLPKVLFLIAETNINDLLPVYWWGDEPSFATAKAEEAMAAVLKEKGYAVADHEAMVLHDTSGEGTSYPQSVSDGETVSPAQGSVVFNNPYLSNEEAAQIGYRLKADIVVVGTAQAEIVPNTMGATIRSFKGNVSLRAVDVETGQEIASVKQEAVAVGADEVAGGNDALSQVGKIAGEALASQIPLSWKKAPGVSGKVDILVQGTGNLGSFVAFRRNLQEIPGVTSLRIKEMKPDEATIAVDYASGAHSLAEALMRQTFQNFGVNISEMEGERLKVEIVPKYGAGSSE